MKFPEHKATLHLTHNEHKNYYEDIESYINDRGDLYTEDSWATPTSKLRAIETNEIWQLQWYPNTPVGFYLIIGATLEEVLEAASRESETNL